MLKATTGARIETESQTHTRVLSDREAQDIILLLDFDTFHVFCFLFSCFLYEEYDGRVSSFPFFLTTLFSLFGSTPFFFFSVKKGSTRAENGMKTAFDKALAECRHTSLRNLTCFCFFWLCFFLLASQLGCVW